jgi:hypothetical protein
MGKETICRTKDGVIKKPEDTKIPVEICLIIHNIADRVRKEMKQKGVHIE